MRHKCRYVGSHSWLIGYIHTRKTISICTIKCFCCLFILCTKLCDNYVGISGSKTRNDYKVLQWIAYTTRMQYWLEEEAEITLLECRFGGYKHADWYTRSLEARLVTYEIKRRVCRVEWLYTRKIIPYCTRVLQLRKDKPIELMCTWHEMTIRIKWEV